MTSMPRVGAGLPFIFLYHGGTLERKGLDLILEAFEIAAVRWAEERPAELSHRNICFVIHSIYGEEEMSRALKDYVTTHARFDDGISVAMFDEYMEESDIQAYP